VLGMPPAFVLSQDQTLTLASSLIALAGSLGQELLAPLRTFCIGSELTSSQFP
jgi:hypothetical protein